MISLQEAAEAKLQRLSRCSEHAPLTDEEVKSHDLTKLTSRETITKRTQRRDLELGYLTFLREIRFPDLFRRLNASEEARCGQASGSQALCGHLLQAGKAPKDLPV